MTTNLFLAPTGLHSGLTSTSLGLIRALEHIGVRAGFFKPIAQKVQEEEQTDRSVLFVRAVSDLTAPTPLDLRYAQGLINRGQSDRLMEEVIGLYQQAAKELDVVVIEGLVPNPADTYTARLNVDLARNLGAEVILVSAPGSRTPAELDEWLDFNVRLFVEPEDPEVVGCILNKVGEPLEDIERDPAFDPRPRTDVPDYARQCRVLSSERLHLIATIPWTPSLLAPRTHDVAIHLTARILNGGERDRRRVHRVAVCDHTIPNMLESLRPGTLLVTPGDREDMVVTTALAALSGVPLAGLVLTGGLTPDARTIDFCRNALDTGLPVLQTRANTYATALELARMPTEVPADDLERIDQVMEAIAGRIDVKWIRARLSTSREPRLSPPAFRYLIAERARKANKRIILPEGNEPRTLQAAVTCHERKLASCVLLGAPAEIHSLAQSLELTLPHDLEIINPDGVREQYVAPMVELRRHKGLTPDMARSQLEDNVVLATMMVALDEVDGLVSGAVHTTANTIRPALQLIKTHAGAKVVSSVFFMCLPDQVLVYGDCAVNPEPDAPTLADIAIQSAESAEAFGIAPRVALISYSTGQSGTGEEVEKVREATRLAKQMRPDLPIDGPLQYDAAADETVARSKAPGSPVAGRATVFVFPDLNTGNTTYKAVQRSANVVSIGPVLQGLRKPVNDLSRGALVEDIIYTIAVTAIQAQQALARENASPKS